MLKNYEYPQDEKSWKAVFENNMLEDIGKMSKEEWRKKLDLQKLCLEVIRNAEQQQKLNENTKPLIDTYSIVDEFFLTTFNEPDKYQIVFKGIAIEEKILNNELSRYYVIESKKLLSEQECNEKVNQKFTTLVLEIVTLSLSACVAGMTKMIKPLTAITLCMSSPFIMYAKAFIEVTINPPSFDSTNYKKVKELYARHYQNNVFVKYVDVQTPCGDYNHII